MVLTPAPTMLNGIRQNQWYREAVTDPLHIGDTILY